MTYRAMFQDTDVQACALATACIISANASGWTLPHTCDPLLVQLTNSHGTLPKTTYFVIVCNIT